MYSQCQFGMPLSCFLVTFQFVLFSVFTADCFKETNLVFFEAQMWLCERVNNYPEQRSFVKCETKTKERKNETSAIPAKNKNVLHFTKSNSKK